MVLCRLDLFSLPLVVCSKRRCSLRAHFDIMFKVAAQTIIVNPSIGGRHEAGRVFHDGTSYVRRYFGRLFWQCYSACYKAAGLWLVLACVRIYPSYI